MVCDICQPQERYYLIYFENTEESKKVNTYFNGWPETKWKKKADRMFCVEETAFFDLMAYIENHLDVNKIYAMIYKNNKTVIDYKKMEPILSFKVQQETSWIDTVIKNDAIRTHFQPIVSIQNNQFQIVGHELLSRGIDSDGQTIPPFKLFEAAKTRGRTFALDRVCRMQSIRNALPVEDKRIFINFIPTAIYVPEHCLASTFKVIEEMNFSPEQVVFEVVETEEVKDINHLKRILNYYKKHGFKYALDDVGVGYNGIDTISQLEPDIVKLAIEFTNGVSNDKDKQATAKRILEAAHKVGAVGLAEGVEEEEDLHYLYNMGYELFQGYYLGKPIDKPLKNVEVQYKPLISKDRWTAIRV